eukprot:UC4_evm2s13
MVRSFFTVLLSILLLVVKPTRAGIPGDLLCKTKLLAFQFASSFLPERLPNDGLKAVALGLGVDPSKQSCKGPIVPNGSCSHLMYGVNLVYGDHSNGGWSTTKNAEECLELCKTNKTCTYGTYHDQTTGRYSNACILHSDGRYNPHRQDGHVSFLCNHTGTIARVPDPNLNSIYWASENRRLDAQPGRHKGWRSSIPRLPDVGKTVYVDSTKGNDDNPGSIDSPLLTIQAAVTLNPVSVILRAGTFFLSEPVIIQANNSGINIAPYQDEDVIISGAVELQPKWTKILSVNSRRPSLPLQTDTYVASIPAGLNFIELFNASNARLVPAREPNGNAELAPEGSNYKFSGRATKCKDFGPCDTVIVNDTCTGCTDKRKGYFGSYSMGVGGPANNFVPPISYWAQPKPHGGGANTYDEGVATSDITGLKESPGGYVFMMQTHHWGSWVYEISNVVANGSNITFGAGGFQEARGGSGGCGTGSFYISHRKELLDYPGEWFLDNAESKLYTVVNQGESPPSVVFASINPYLFRIEGTQETPVKSVRISSLTLRHAAPTYMSNYSVGSGGDYSIHRGGAITLIGTENVTIDHNLFDGVGGNGVWMHAYNRHALISANEMRNLGENGVGLTGETEWVDGTGGNQPRFNTVSGNIIHHLGIYTKQACAVFSAVSCQNLIEENVFFHGPRALFNMNDDFGGGTVIRKNLFFKALLETSDQ